LPRIGVLFERSTLLSIAVTGGCRGCRQIFSYARKALSGEDAV